jgi:hypothetical protein
MSSPEVWWEDVLVCGVMPPSVDGAFGDSGRSDGRLEQTLAALCTMDAVVAVYSTLYSSC